jgi:RluA family pseudouridine synthase
MNAPKTPVYHQDKYIIVLNKPAGMPTQGTTDPRQSHLYGELCERFSYVGLHHRLDTPASGLVLFTLDRSVNKAISKAFKQHWIERKYLAIVAGNPGESGTWSVKIDGKAATTHFERLAQADGMSLIEASLETGRTHQIRIHAATASHPIIGDRRHGGAASKLWPRLALHAVSLAFRHPKDRAPLKVWAPPPLDLMPLVEPLLSEMGSSLDHRYSPGTEAG